MSSDHQEQYNRGGMWAFMFSMAFVFSFMFYLVAIHPGVTLDEKIVDPNAKVEGTQKAAFDIATVKEPWVSTPEIVQYGQKLFATNCAMCHGAEGKGDGAAGSALNPKPRNFVEGKWTQGNGIIAHYKVLQNGIKGSSMAGYGHFKTADRWAILHFLESITTNKSADSAEAVAEFAKTAQ